MDNRPLILILERSNDFTYTNNTDRDILALVLRQRLGLDVLIVESWFDLKDTRGNRGLVRKLNRIKEARDCGRLIGAIMATNELEFEKGVNYLQKELLPGVPLIFVKPLDRHEDDLCPQKTGSALSLRHHDPELQEWARSLQASWRSGNLAKLSPPATIVNKEYQQQLEKINSLSKIQKKRLADKLLESNGYAVSLGNSVKGFAIHTSLLEWRMSWGFGSHRSCIDTLWHHLEIAHFEYPDLSLNEKMRDGVVLFGLLFTDPPEEFSYEVIVLYDFNEASEYETKRVVDLIVAEHEWLPILSSDFVTS